MPYLKLDGQFRLHYRIEDHTDPWTQPETVIFVHGFCENSNVWRAWVPHFSRQYRMVRFDQRGFGKSTPAPPGYTYTTDLFADDLVRLINTVSDRPVHIVAGKSGAISVIHLAGTRPDLVASVTLVCSGLWPPKAQGRIEHMETHGVRSWARSTMRGRLGSRIPPRGIDWWVDVMGSTPLDTACAYMRWVATVDVTPDLERIQCPALVMTTSVPVREKAGTTLHERIAHSELEVVDVDGFNAYGADPDGCAVRTLKFLDRIRGRAKAKNTPPDDETSARSPVRTHR
jgi:pimeloyl-ACP methyl ester carboxylesterase